MNQFKHKNKQFVFALTGGGSLFLSDILCAGGASQFLVHAEIPYNEKSLNKFVGGIREKAASECTARQLAVASEAYAKGLGIEAVGVGFTASLSKGEGERKGRVHTIFVAATFKESCVAVTWEHKGQRYTREEEEKIAAKLIKEVSEIFADYIDGQSHLIDHGLEAAFKNFGTTLIWTKVTVSYPSTFAKEQLRSLLNTKGIGFYDSICFGRFHKAQKICIYPGSFNPVHVQHEANFKKCQELYGADNCFLEISIANFEKPNLDSIELTNRIHNMRKVTPNIIITNAAKFVDKVKEVEKKVGQGKRIVFAVGHDTLERIEEIEFPCSFLVFPRNGGKVDPKRKDVRLIEPATFDLTEGENISSSELRKNYGR